MSQLVTKGYDCCCSFSEGSSGDDIIMNTGTEVGALLVDGLGDGVAVSCPSQDLSFLRNMSFGVLQGSRMRNTKTGHYFFGLDQACCDHLSCHHARVFVMAT